MLLQFFGLLLLLLLLLATTFETPALRLKRSLAKSARNYSRESSELAKVAGGAEGYPVIAVEWLAAATILSTLLLYEGSCLN